MGKIYQLKELKDGQFTHAELTALTDETMTKARCNLGIYEKSGEGEAVFKQLYSNYIVSVDELDGFEPEAYAEEGE